MDSPKDDKAAPEASKAAPEASKAAPDAPRLSRRSVMQAGLKAGPVLMTLPTVPAWAVTNQSATSCGTNPDTESCRAQGYESSGLNDQNDIFDPVPPASGPAGNKGKKKDDDEDGVFLSSGNWLKNNNGKKKP